MINAQSISCRLLDRDVRFDFESAAGTVARCLRSICCNTRGENTRVPQARHFIARRVSAG
jgi:hypothetical protein